MLFAKVDTTIDFAAQERQILDFWQKTRAFERLCELRMDGPRWSFLDGPITANNPMGVHHAWGRTLKDLYQRYHAMLGARQRYQNGFDCQGLWVEVEVERELGLKSKQEIENLIPGDKFASIDKFVTLCKQRVDKFAKRQTEQTIRLGNWMDWDREEDWTKRPDDRRSYYTMAERNNFAIWAFLRKCHGRGLVYRAFDSMPWCPRCAVGISQMEMHEGYQMTAHRAVFVRFPLLSPSPLGGVGRGEGATPREYLLVWTTTPWTLSSNVAAAVNPELTYLMVRQNEEVYYLAKNAFDFIRLEDDFKRGNWAAGVPKLKPPSQLFKEKGPFEIVGELPGSQLVGRKYQGPLDDLPAQANAYGYPEAIARVVERQQWAPAAAGKDAHRVIPWSAVGATEGTGIVHIAPGCGKEDFALGKEHGLPPIAPLDEEGFFLKGFGFLEGKSAYEESTVDLILDELKKRGALFAIEKYPHNYPHCWRCKTELLFRLVDEWFINMNWREEIIRICKEARWIPEFGYDREIDWLRNMGDWMISKKRYWGLALPIWVDEQTGDFEVIGSKDELKARAVQGWDKFEGHSPHRPWIDLVKIRNPKTGNLMARIPDVGNPWLDAGIVPYSTLGYFENREEWARWFPADFITESFPGQFRNWFYAILAMSAMLEGRAPFKTLLGHAQVRDEHGEEMHKSKGNAILFEAAADEGWDVKTKDGRVEHKPPMTADVMRWMYTRQNPVNNLNFGAGPAEEIRSKFILKLWNTYAFFCNYARLDAFDPAAPQVPVKDRPDLDRWILSDLQLLVKKAREAFDAYSHQTFCQECEAFVDDRLSNWYVRRSRRRFWKSEQSADKQAAYQTLYTVLTTLAKLIAPVTPFITEAMWQNLVGAAALATGTGSVHHERYPAVDEKLIDQQLSDDVAALLRLVSLGSAARNLVKIKVRQPLAELRVQPASDGDRRAIERFADQLAEELNLKKVTLHTDASQPLVRFVLKLNLKSAAPKLGPRLKETQALLAQVEHAALVEDVQQARPVVLHLASGAVTLEPADLQVEVVAEEGWSGIADRGAIVALDTRITPALKAEGQAREVVRHIQNLRKDANLNLEDRIGLYLNTSSAELEAAIALNKDYIAAETLTTKWSDQRLGPGVASADVKVDGQPLRIELRKQ